MSNRLGGKQGTAYLGTNANQPPNITFAKRAPTTFDINNVVVGDFWIDESASGVNKLWWLASLEGNSLSKGASADWVQFGTSVGVNTLDGNAGSATEIAGIINVIGMDGITTTGVGNTLTISLASGQAGIVSEFTTDAGDADPAAGIISIIGANGLTTSAAGNVITIGLANDPGAGVPIVELAADTGDAVTANGLIHISGGHDINTDAVGSVVTINLDNAITLGDITPIAANNPALTAITGDIDIDAGNINLPQTAAAGAAGTIFIGAGPSATLIHSYTDNIIAPFSNFFAGQSAGNFTSTGYSNTMLGQQTATGLTTGTNNSSLGYKSQKALTTGSNNSSLGGQSLFSVTSGLANTAAGSFALEFITTGSDNTALGWSAGVNYTNGDESYNTIVGDSNAGVAGEVGVVRIGAWNNTTPTNNSNTFVGYRSGNISYTLASSTFNTCLGSFNGNALTTGASNTLVGAASGNLISSGSFNVILGDVSGVNITTGTQNVILGRASATALVSGTQNCTVGNEILTLAVTPNFNVAIGQAALEVATTATSNVAIGNLVLDAATSSVSNTVVGGTAMTNILTGGYNTVLGFNGGVAYTGAESSNILIGHPGVVGETNTLHIGNFGSGNGQINTAYIASVFTTAVTGIGVLVDATGLIGTATSSIRFKENVQPMADASSPVMNLQPVIFNYKKDEKKERKYGLIAEDVLKIMPDLVVYDDQNEPYAVKYQDLPAILLNEVQKLSKRVADLEAKLAAKG